MKGFGLIHRFAGLFTVIVVSIGGVLLVQTLMIQTQRSDWQTLKDQTLARERLLLSIRSQMGYGALIHNFKNYVLRGQEKYYQRISENHAAVTGGLEQYRLLTDLTEGERNALDSIQGIADRYLASTDVVRDLLARGADTGSIDKSVKVSDLPAVEGFAHLQGRYSELLNLYMRASETRANTAAGYAFMLLAGCLAVILLAAFALYWHISGRLHVLREEEHKLSLREANLSQRMDTPDDVGSSGNVSSISLLSAETAAVVARNKAAIAELDHTRDSLTDRVPHFKVR